MKIRKIVKANKSIPKKKTSVQAADFDATAFKERRRAARADREGKRDKRMTDILNQIRESDDQMQTAFDLLVPSSGKADTLAGELVRAMMRILYRDYNDGDVFYEGYGVETCGDAVAFLCDKIPDLQDEFAYIAYNVLENSAYTKAIQDIADSVIEYIMSNPDTVVTQNDEDMFRYNGEKFIRDNEWEPSYETDCDLPDNVIAHIEAGNVSTSDIEWDMENWDYLSDADITVHREYVHVEDIKDKDTLNEIEENLYSWLEDFGNQLTDEYGDPEEEEEEEDDEE